MQGTKGIGITALFLAPLLVAWAPVAHSQQPLDSYKHALNSLLENLFLQSAKKAIRNFDGRAQRSIKDDDKTTKYQASFSAATATNSAVRTTRESIRAINAAKTKEEALAEFYNGVIKLLALRYRALRDIRLALQAAFGAAKEHLADPVGPLRPCDLKITVKTFDASVAAGVVSFKGSWVITSSHPRIVQSISLQFVYFDKDGKQLSMIGIPIFNPNPKMGSPGDKPPAGRKGRTSLNPYFVSGSPADRGVEGSQTFPNPPGATHVKVHLVIMAQDSSQPVPCVEILDKTSKLLPLK